MSKNYLEFISDTEAERLSMQHQAWKPETDSFLRRVGFSSFNNVVDFGCGPGLTACDIATEVNPSAHVFGVDISDLYLGHLRSVAEQRQIKNLQVQKADITVPIDFGMKFDGGFCRWFLAWIAKDLDTVLRNIFNSLRPGGKFAAMEYLTLRSTVSAPKSRAFDHMVNAWEQFYVQCGGTTEIGSRLPAALTNAGFRISDIQCVGGLARSGHRHFKWWKRLNEDFNKTFIEKGVLTDAQEGELKEFWQANAENPDAFIYTPLILQIEATVPG